MKRLLFFSVLSIFCLTISAQTKTWIGPLGGSFNVAENWNPSGIPGSTNDVIIPTGSNIIIDGANIKSFALQGNAQATASNITFSDASSIDADASLDMTYTELIGSGTLTNNGTIVFTHLRSVRGSLTIINNGVINLNQSGTIYAGYGTPTLNNTASGIINLNAEDGGLYQQSGEMTIINSGLIKRAHGSGAYRIEIPLQNNNGTVSVENGSLTLYNPATVLTDGTYNVANDAVLNFNHTFTLNGTLSGQLDGPINWAGKLLVAPSTEATLNFNGSGDFNWISGEFKGEGTLTNKGVLNLDGSGSIRGNSTLKNEGSININSTSTYYFGYGSPTLTNTASGVINILSDGAISGQDGFVTLNNSGTIKKEPSTGNFFIDANVTNSAPGKIIAETGLLKFGFGTFEGDGMLTGNGAVAIQNNLVYDGTISPGGMLGTLIYAGNYSSSANAILATEIYGPTAGTEYDVFDVNGTASLDGDILVSLNYEANQNDEFVILTANSITTCNLPATVTAHYDNHDYTFDVICNPTNVTLKITNIVLGTEDNTLSNLAMYPNPSSGHFTIDLGKDYSDVNLQIHNMLGQQISSNKYASIKTIEQEINTSAGIYFVKVSSKGVSKTLKLIKN